MAITVPGHIVEAAVRGGDDALERLLTAIWPDAYRLAYAILGDAQTAEDATQEACVIVYRTIHSLRNPASFGAWLYRIIVRESSALKRRKSATNEIPDTPAEVPDGIAPIDVWQALARLPENLRRIVVLRYFEDLSSREIATILGIPSGTIRFQLLIARRRLRPLLADYVQPGTTTSHEVTTNAI